MSYISGPCKHEINRTACCEQVRAAFWLAVFARISGLSLNALTAQLAERFLVEAHVFVKEGAVSIQGLTAWIVNADRNLVSFGSPPQGARSSDTAVSLSGRL